MKKYIVIITVAVSAYSLLNSDPVVPNVSAVDKAPDFVTTIKTVEYDDHWAASEKHIRAEKMLAGMMFGECRGQSRRCMTAVGHVAMNRARLDLDHRYGKGLTGVLKKRKAFSCFNKSDPNLKSINKALSGKLKPGTKAYAKWELAKEVAHELMHVGGDDPTNGSTHYHASWMKATWAGDDGMTKVAQFDGHIFYKFR